MTYTAMVRTVKQGLGWGVLGGMAVAGLYGGSRFLSFPQGFLLAPRIDPTAVIVQQMRGVQELTTTVFTLQTLVPTEQTRQVGPWEVGKTKLLYIGHGEVRAGLDLSLLDPSAIRWSGDRLEITLPPPQILDAKIDIHRSQVYDYDRGFLNLGPDTAPDLQTFAQRQTLTQLVTAACDQGILDQANHQAIALIQSLLASSVTVPLTVQASAPGPCQFSPEDPKPNPF